MRAARSVGKIGDGLDCDNAFLIDRLGLKDILLYLMYEMGHCGRKSIDTEGIATPFSSHHVMLTLQDFVCLTERLNTKDDHAKSEEASRNSNESNNK